MLSPELTLAEAFGAASSFLGSALGASCFGSSFLGSSLGASSFAGASSLGSAFGSSFFSEAAGFALPSPMRAMTAPTSMVSSSSARISTRVPATGDGISVSTLSVETSSSGSSTSTVSPTDFSHWELVPSVTDSPSSGISTSVASLEAESLEAAGADSSAAGSSLAGASSLGSAFGSSFFSEAAGFALPSPMRAMTAPTSMLSASSVWISTRVPATGDGISVSTLSVETSSSGSSTSTVSPTDFSHWVMVPSVTDSPSSGISTSVASPEAESLEAAGADSSAAGSSLGASSFAGASSLGSAFGSSFFSEAAGFALPSPMRAMTAPTSMVSSSSARISTRVPATGDGISVSTLSVETSSSGSSASTVSPTDFSHWVMVPSVTDSPSSGISTSVASPEAESLEAAGADSSAAGSSFAGASSSSSAGASEE